MPKRPLLSARALRLRSFAESPDAFARTLEEERAVPDTRWRERAQANAEGVASIGFFALCDGAEIGLAVAFGVRAIRRQSN